MCGLPAMCKACPVIVHFTHGTPLFFFHFLLGIYLIYIYNAIPKVPPKPPPPPPHTPPPPPIWAGGTNGGGNKIFL